MIKSLRPLLLAGLLLPLAFSATAATVNNTLPPNVQQALAKAKLQNNALSLVMIPLNGPGTPTIFNADVSVNPASTMKLVTTYAALEMLGPNHQWKTEFYTGGDGFQRDNQYPEPPVQPADGETAPGHFEMLDGSSIATAGVVAGRGV